MAYRKKTLRRMSPTARRLARLSGEMESVQHGLRKLIPEVQRLEADSRALWNKQEYDRHYDQAMRDMDEIAEEFEGEGKLTMQELTERIS